MPPGAGGAGAAWVTPVASGSPLTAAAGGQPD